MTSKGSRIIVRYCAEEVERQGDGPIAVAGLYNAWMDALAGGTLDAKRLILWGYLAKPNHNPADSFRTCNVRVGDHVAPRCEEVPSLIDQWLVSIPKITPAEAYKEFQHIHPFRDGNGRVGKVIFNWLADTLTTPILPPNFFGCRNL